MNFPFGSDIVVENDLAVLRPINGSDVNNLLPVAGKDKDPLQFSPAPIYNGDLLGEYIAGRLRIG